MSLTEIFFNTPDRVLMYGTVNGYDGAVYRDKGSYIICSNSYKGAGGHMSFNNTLKFSGFISTSGNFSGFKPNQYDIRCKYPQEKPVAAEANIGTTIIEFDTFISVNQNF